MRDHRGLSLVLLALVWGCSGSDGRNGDPGATGEQGPEGEQGDPGEPGVDGEDAEPRVPALSAVMPGALEQGQTATVTIIGDATHFDDTTTASFGAGVTVDEVAVGSAGWLEVRVTVAGDAEVGGREVAANTGDETVVMPDGIVVQERIADYTVNVESLTAGQFAYMTVTAREAVFNQFTTLSVCGSYDEQGACVFSPNVNFFAPYLNDSSHISFVIQVDIYAAETTVDLVIGVAGEDQTIPLAITSTTPVVLEENDLVSGNIEVENGMDAFSFTTETVGRYTIQLSPTDSDTLHPHIEVFNDFDGLFPMLDVYGTSASFNALVPGTTYVVVISDDYNDGRVGGGADGYSYGIQLSSAGFPDITTDLEDDGTLSVDGSIAEDFEQDLFRIVPTVDATIDVTLAPSDDLATALTDGTLALYDADFNELTWVDANFADGGEVLEPQALTAGATYFVAAAGSCYQDFFSGALYCGLGDYTLTVTRQ